MEGEFFQGNYRPQFSGHQTFPLRYGWLKKAYDEVADTENDSDNKYVFLDDKAIARFGVGKNMVSSIRHWGVATGVLNEERGCPVIKTTDLGTLLFGEIGLDPYMEHPASLWLIHWQLVARREKTTWFWAFNFYSNLSFDRDRIVYGIKRLANEQNWQRAGLTTITNDVACFIRTYVSRQPSARVGNDDAHESPLTELGLIKAVGKWGEFRFVRGPKPTLGNGVFTYALLDFWSRYSKETTSLSFEAISHAPGSPGRVFLLSETEIVNRLAELDKLTKGKLRWSETAGLKQVMRTAEGKLENRHSYIGSDYT